jgi:hypothetical protein
MQEDGVMKEGLKAPSTFIQCNCIFASDAASKTNSVLTSSRAIRLERLPAVAATQTCLMLEIQERA